MLGQHSLLSLLVVLFVSVSSVWARNVTVLADDKRLVFSNSSISMGTWQFNDTGLCGNDGGIVQTYNTEDWVRLRFNGTAVYVVLAQYDMAALTTVMIDGVQANVTAQNYTLELTSDGCDTRTLFATNMTNTNHTVTVSYAGTGLGRTVLNKIIYDDGSDTPRADPTATRVAVTIGDTGASPTATPSASADTTPGCGNGCKATSIGGGAGLIITLIFLWCFWRCCCGSRRTHTEVHTVTVVRPPSPPPRPIIVVAATLEVQQTHIQVNRVDRNSAVASPPAYEQTNYK